MGRHLLPARLPARLPAGLVVPALLVGLVALLATLQYRWLGKVSDAEREQLRRTLAQRAREFADEFDGEIGRAYRSLQVPRGEGTATDWTEFAASFERWKATARDAQLIRAVYLAEAVGGEHTIRRWDSTQRTFDAKPLASWPESLEPVRRQMGLLTAAGTRPAVSHAAVAHATVPEGKTTIVAMAAIGPVNADVPALIVPVGSPLARSGDAAGVDSAGGVADPGAAVGAERAMVRTAESLARSALLWVPQPTAYVIAELDAGRLKGVVLPNLIARHFPAHGADDTRVVVLAASGAPLYARGLAPGASLDPDTADVVTPFFGLRLDLLRDAVLGTGAEPSARTEATASSATPAEREPADVRAGEVRSAEGRVSVFLESRIGAGPGSAEGATAASLVRIARPGWRLVLQHGAGSLDAAVSQVRRRNLALSFGILGVLAAGVVLVVANARRSEQLAARQMDFVAAVSHELRTPLAVIRSAAQNLSAGVVDDPARARRYGELIDDEGRRLTEMIEQVLDYAGLGDNRRLREARRVDVAALVDEVVAEWGPDITTAGFAVEVEGLDAMDGGGPGAVPAVSGDPDALRRALHNLVGNALKHARSGQWLGIAVRAEPPGRPREVVIDVRDHGPGVEAGDLAHLFEPFYRGRRAVSQQVHGNGLGLSLVKAIIEAHGGRVSVRSGYGGGAVFTMRLPAAEPVAAGGAEADPVEGGGGESQMTGGDPDADGAEGSRSQACDPAAGGGGPA